MISGLLVLIAGIPAGLYLDSLRRKSEERIKENEDKEQEIIVLKALLEELGNSNEFFLFQRKGVSTSVVADRMSVEVWDTFKSSSRLNYIDNSLLPALARAYELVRKVQSLENDALKGFAYHPTNIRLSDGTATNGWLVILKQARSFDEALSDSVENALYLIEERLDNLNFFNS